MRCPTLRVLHILLVLGNSVGCHGNATAVCVSWPPVARGEEERDRGCFSTKDTCVVSSEHGQQLFTLEPGHHKLAREFVQVTGHTHTLTHTEEGRALGGGGHSSAPATEPLLPLLECAPGHSHGFTTAMWTGFLV